MRVVYGHKVILFPGTDDSGEVSTYSKLMNVQFFNLATLLSSHHKSSHCMYRLAFHHVTTPLHLVINTESLLVGYMTTLRIKTCV